MRKAAVTVSGFGQAAFTAPVEGKACLIGLDVHAGQLVEAMDLGVLLGEKVAEAPKVPLDALEG